MPIREYRCPFCDHLQEEIQLSGLEDDVFCEKCGIEMKEIISSKGSVHFKGVGWSHDSIKQRQRWFDKK